MLNTTSDKGGVALQKNLNLVQTRLHLASKIFRFFTNLRGRKGVDAEGFQILSAFILAGLAELQRQQTKQFSQDTFVASLTATALSEMTGIPRQTVRRKLERMEKLGLVARQEDSGYVMTTYHPDLDLIHVIQTSLEASSGLSAVALTA
ncbi:MarR family transcriptional regulator [Phenylobacterium aquaticum]|uniref:MarR family transcriptional regulator n=1 Tax=Phenylobacterium aquaticum TaxID=1763816 RepID=UPI001F5C6D1F|nr:MarR family transcriptional regulator [Phenylobacterium aquaticum]MCI3132717.1 helix-turn-helix domain-containing protein [Phenylobacterium aquaticum]